jgi:hypothetical protein
VRSWAGDHVRRVFALTPEDVALLGGVAPAPEDLDSANLAASCLGFTLDWSRVVTASGMTWRLTVETQRGRFDCQADSEDGWRTVLGHVGLLP